MSHTIAVAGKGGTGKTTLCGLLVDYLCKTGKTPVLAVDADANSNLNEVLGVDIELTLGDLREEILTSEMNPENPIPASMTKADYLDIKFGDALIEQDDYDMLVMGRTQGRGCYCFVNGLLQSQLTKFSGNYKYIVVDNEAGLEHISRGVLPSIDTVLLVSDPSRRGVQAVARIAELIRSLNLKPTMMKLIINRARDGKLDPGTLEEIEKNGLDLAGVVPQDELIYQYDCDGKPLVELPADSEARKAFEDILRKIIV